MKQLISLLFALALILSEACAQPYYESLHIQLKFDKDDTTKVKTLCALAQYHAYTNSDSNIFYVDKAIKLAEKINYPQGKLQANVELFFAANFKSNYTKTLEIALNNLKIAGDLKEHRLYQMALIHLNLNLINREMGDERNAAINLSEAFELQEKSGEINGDFWAAYAWKSITLAAKPDSALYYARLGYEMAKYSPNQFVYLGLASAYLGNAYRVAGKYDTARKYLQVALDECIKYNNVYIEGRVFRDLANLSNKTGAPDSCIYFSKLGLQLCLRYGFGDYASQLSQILAQVYESQHKSDSALKYFKVMGVAKDSIFSQAKMLQFQKLLSAADQKQKESQIASEEYRTRVRLYSLIAIVCIFFILLMIMYRNNLQKQKAYKLITKQKNETDLQKLKVEQAYQELKSTQAQLVQSEKMASLGELTAGIAHEIQNPLNFVNNFAEVNKELIDEALQAIKTGNPNDAMELMQALKDNENRINHHGKRADAIVKGMLQHSRSSFSTKEPTGINALADEYLRLAYHRFKAKDNSFNATLETDFDESIDKINIVPQDIGRVLLNLYNNAFYAVSEKKMRLGGIYEPTVSLSTKKNLDKIEIRIKDNGSGIPQKIVAKIFQPFFTTKPSGQGTGLGLSLSYDILKAYGSEIKVETKEGEGSIFTFQLLFQ